MNLNLIRFFLLGYSKSYKYFPPIVIYIILIILLYGYKPNPILGSYSLTSTMLFYFACWIGYSFIYSENPVQQQVTAVHFGQIGKYFLLKVISVYSLVFLLGVFTIVYPLALNVFDKSITLTELGITFLSHMGLGLLGVSTSLFFNPRIFKKSSTSLGALFLMCVIVISIKGIINITNLDLDLLLLVVPPLFNVVDTLINIEHYEKLEVAIILIWPFMYSILCISIFVKVMKRKLF